MKIDRPDQALDFIADLVRRRPGLGPVGKQLGTRSLLFQRMTQGRGKPTTFAENYGKNKEKS